MAETKKEEKKRKTPLSVRIGLFLMLVVAVVFLPATVVFMVCMLPTFVAALVDRHPQKTMWITIGALNLAGTVPAWYALWDRGSDIKDALAVVSDAGTLLMAYGAAAGGWMIHQNITPLVASMMVRRSEGRLREIDRRQKELLRKWGEDIAKTG